MADTLDVERLRALHRRVEPFRPIGPSEPRPPYCDQCGDFWPCPVWQLLDERDTLNRERDMALDECRTRGIELEHARTAGPPGLWRCLRCNFVCVRSTINAYDGSITANHDEPEPCPNDGEHLVRVTWREHAIEMAARAEEQMGLAREDAEERKRLADPPERSCAYGHTSYFGTCPGCQMLAKETKECAEERDRLRDAYDGACQTIARMHAAATGAVQGPLRGVVEDVEDVRAQLDAVERDLRRRFELHDERIALMHAIQRKEARREQLSDTAGAYNRECDEIDARLRAALTAPKAPTTTKGTANGSN